ncbi:hypothetical protein A2334_01605 [Candidatus Roizmanbacteria bacterium RIFOXYB2_FULL_38_10]|uniref:DUF5673 domain-containing protein n=1 Tax=Candidatus Roizmanbacteria bacterium RIFOXYD1_FULL_38_12 TaxID=1802093 RepID=A0A1F7L231_9BACT|nr:MAG: hypothetical protein A3K47_05455 [Candidatus Roizmanbacteria bacterium RIFOXYA2_FULL_38_14]OGK64190.1 MAG: hypothetical protein A3K27_05455 [Candidatus Roizmanbacteria bacterium RIFOXYA1_FULL_37_12]OGK66036.1 MAG: hypothetical protein A3K38_05455 [Candidatus Roizmanbacteria bacterium RIFOXYB1_FULL_40_23]OGK68545.1 MAG: hypothetical protein A2334_01605 [Candidatus Roizmanbacteria bacterium RIFOXYB2_FULL_38_10]OGK70441.1 MAG: hypothetical protein A3K21_05460 [Candidatus Roizmanbacteria ba
MEGSSNITKENPQRLFSWKAPLRAYKKRSKNILRFYVALSLLISLIVFFFGDRILLIPILTLVFLFYVLTVTPPPEVEHYVTTFGIETTGITLRWEVLSHFYFTKKFGFDVLTVVSHAPYFYHAYLIVPNENIKQQVVELFTKHLMYMEKPPRRFTDKVVDFLSSLVPDEEDHVKKAVSPSSLNQTHAQASL